MDFIDYSECANCHYSIGLDAATHNWTHIFDNEAKCRHAEPIDMTLSQDDIDNIG